MFKKTYPKLSIVILILEILILSSCESKYKKEIKMLQSNYWIITSTVLDIYTTHTITKNDVQREERTIHIFDKSGNIIIFDWQGNFKNSFRYKTIEESNRFSELLVSDKFNHDSKYLVMISNGFLDLTEIIIKDGTTASQQSIFVPLSDSILIKRIKTILEKKIYGVTD